MSKTKSVWTHETARQYVRPLRWLQTVRTALIAPPSWLECPPRSFENFGTGLARPSAAIRVAATPIQASANERSQRRRRHRSAVVRDLARCRRCSSERVRHGSSRCAALHRVLPQFGDSQGRRDPRVRQAQGASATHWPACVNSQNVTAFRRLRAARGMCGADRLLANAIWTPRCPNRRMFSDACHPAFFDRRALSHRQRNRRPLHQHAKSIRSHATAFRTSLSVFDTRRIACRHDAAMARDRQPVRRDRCDVTRHPLPAGRAPGSVVGERRKVAATAPPPPSSITRSR